MRRRIVVFVLCLCLTCMLPVSAFAALYDDHGIFQYVADQADLLTEQEQTELEATARELSVTSGCDVLIAAVDDIDGYSAGEYAAMLNAGQWWDSENAVLFLLAMEEREWYIATFGDAIYIFTDHALDSLGEVAVASFAEGDYYGGFSDYLDLLPLYFDAWKNSAPIDNYDYDPGPRDEAVYYEPYQTKTIGNVLPVSLLIGVISAAICLLIMRSSMNSKRRQRSAGEYLKPGSYHLRTHHDLFLYSNVSKARRQQNTGSSGGHRGGGSTVHRSSGGRSHGGRGGRF